MVRVLLVSSFLGACSFQAVPSSGEDIPEPVPPEEAPINSDDIVNIAMADERFESGDLLIAAPLIINTGTTTDPATLAFGMPLPAGVTFTVAKLNGTGGELAVLRGHALRVQAHVQVIGSRPLVVLADTFDLSDTFDVTAHADPAGTVALVSHAGGGIEIYARTQISISGNLNAGSSSGDGAVGPPHGGGASGAIILQSPAVHNSGHLSASGGQMADFGPGGGGGGSDRGQIILLYRTSILMKGTTNPLTIPQPY
jgi:hypothetical protein